MPKKICSSCREEKSLDDFYINRATKDGHQTICKECQRSRQREERASGVAAERDRRSYAKNRGARIAAQVAKVRVRKATLVAEAGGECQNCGYDKSLAALSFHHRDPQSKVFEIGAKLASYGLERLRAEAAKCDLLCANCHMELEWVA